MRQQGHPPLRLATQPGAHVGRPTGLQVWKRRKLQCHSQSCMAIQLGSLHLAQDDAIGIPVSGDQRSLKGWEGACTIKAQLSRTDLILWHISAV